MCVHKPSSSSGTRESARPILYGSGSCFLSERTTMQLGRAKQVRKALSLVAGECSPWSATRARQPPGPGAFCCRRNYSVKPRYVNTRTEVPFSFRLDDRRRFWLATRQLLSPVAEDDWAVPLAACHCHRLSLPWRSRSTRSNIDW